MLSIVVASFVDVHNTKKLLAKPASGQRERCKKASRQIGFDGMHAMLNSLIR